MAHFAKIGMSNKVLTVLTLDNQILEDVNGNEIEANGQQYLETHNNWPAQMWIQTSFNTHKNTHSKGGTPFRGNFAGIGYTWNEDDQFFWPKKPYASWVKNTSEVRWQSPIGDAPVLTQENLDNLQHYDWNEENQSWDLI